MAKISRSDAREELFGLMFEIEFQTEANPTEIYERSCNNREIPTDAYIKKAFFGIISKRDVLDEVIRRYAEGWKTERLSRVARAILRIAVYEILFVDDIHPNISISQAVTLAAKFGEDKAKQFVNGVLAGLFKDWESLGAEAIISAAVQSLEATKQPEGQADEATTAESGENV